MDNVAQKIYFGMDVSDKFVEIFALTPDSAQNRRMKIENNRESLSYLVVSDILRPELREEYISVPPRKAIGWRGIRLVSERDGE